MACFALLKTNKLTTSMTRASSVPTARDSLNGKLPIIKPATEKPTSGTKTNIQIQLMECFLIFFAASSISGELHLSENWIGYTK